MMSGEEIQIENGEYTRIHNEILERLARAHLNGQEFRAVLFLLRKTYGWHKKEDAISLSQWAEGLGVKRTDKVARVLAGLIEKKIIYRERKVGLTWVYGFNKYYDEWENEARQATPQEDTPLQGTPLQGGRGTPLLGGEPHPNRGEEVHPNRGVTKDNLKILTKENIKIDAGGKPPPAGEPSKPKRKTRQKKPKDERSKHPAIQAIFGITGRYPPREVYDILISKIGEHPDGERLARCWKVWRQVIPGKKQAYSPVNYGWVVDWYANKSIPNFNGGNLSDQGYTYVGEP